MRKDIYYREVRVSNTARERLFTIGISTLLYDDLGGHDTKVSVQHSLTRNGLRVVVRKDPEGIQKLRNISHEEFGLRINSRQNNPVEFPFKSLRLIANLTDDGFEFVIPFTKMKEAKPRGHRDLLLASLL